jgi:hypothetical protein
MEKQEMIDFLKSRDLFERGMNQLVQWELMEKVEMAMEMGLPSKEEIKEMTEPKKVVKEELKKEKPQLVEELKPTLKPKAKPKAKKAKKD